VLAGAVLPLTILLLVERHRPRELRPHQLRPGILERTVGHVTALRPAIVIPALVVGVVVAAAGLVVEGRMPIQTEPEAWVSPNGTAVTELRELRSSTGFSDQIGLEVQADDVTSDAVVAWIYRFETTEQQRHPGDLLEAASMPEIAGDVVGLAPTGDDVRALLDLAPRDVHASLVTADRKTANVVFPVGDISLAKRNTLLKSLEGDLRGDLAPPSGVRVTPAGLGVIGIELVHGMEANRQTLTLAALALVALWLLARGRLRPRALLPLVPVTIAVGVSTFVIWALGFEFTPLTTVAAPLVIAVATEFTVLLEARYADERRHGCTPLEACARLPRIARAFVASGLTLVGGFAVMAASPMILLRDFGMVVAIDVVVALVSALVIMPPLLRWTDRRHEQDLDVLWQLELRRHEHRPTATSP
jgi:predicted RND superfamily exporter protein